MESGKESKKHLEELKTTMPLNLRVTPTQRKQPCAEEEDSQEHERNEEKMKLTNEMNELS
jgi:hypothetical protein